MEKQLNELLDHVLDEKFITEETKTKAEWVIADTVVAVLYGLKSEKEIERYLEGAASSQPEGDRVFPIVGAALYANKKDSLILHGTATVANELDEGNTFAKGHPSAHILPAILVSALENHATTEQVVTAYIQAYEISSRLSYASSMKDDMHPHGTWGNVGGAAARAIIEGKTIEEIREIVLLSLSLPLSTSWLAAEKGQSVRNLYTGIGSFLAYESVSLQGYGFASNVEVAKNLWAQLMGNGMDANRLTEQLDGEWMITKNYFKTHPSCRFTHASIDAALELRDSQSVDVEQIEKVEVDTYSLAARCDTAQPQTKLQSKFSIPYTVACTLMEVDMFQHYEENLPLVQELVNRITVRESPALNELLPGKRAATVTITFKDGSKVIRTVDTARGEFTHPFTAEEMWDKYRNMLKGHYPDPFFHILKENLLNHRKHATFKEWLIANQLMEG